MSTVFGASFEHWAYQRPVYVLERSGQTLANYSLNLSIDTSALILSGKMRQDCGDLRFADLGGDELSYYVESGCGTTNTVVWVKIPSIAAGVNKTIHMYYGNPQAASKSDGDGAFEFFDGFDYTSDHSSDRVASWVTNSASYYDGFPSVAKAANGDLILAYRRGASHAANDGYVVKQKSSDGGRTWSSPEVLYDHPSYDVRDPQLHLAPNGDVIAFVMIYNIAGRTIQGIKYAISSDNGTSFGQWQDFPNIGSNVSVIFSSHLVNVGGVIYGVVYAISDNGNADTGASLDFLWRSEDNGATWQSVSLVNGAPDHSNEAAIAWIPSEGRFIVIGRDANNAATWKRRSLDSTGTTWGTKSDISSQVGVIQDPELDWINGTLVLAGRSYATLEMVQYFSDDLGETFKDRYVLEAYKPSVTEGGYTSTAVINNSAALTVFYTNTLHASMPDIRQLVYGIPVQKGSVLNSSKWQTVGSPTVSVNGSSLSISCNAAEWIESGAFERAPPAILEARSRDNPYGSRNYSATYGFGKYNYPITYSGVRREIYTSGQYTLMACDGSSRDYSAAVGRNAQYATYRIVWTQGLCSIYENGVRKDAGEVSSYIPKSPLKVTIGRTYYANELNTFDIDWIRVRAYASKEPQASLGTEEPTTPTTSTTTTIPTTTSTSSTTTSSTQPTSTSTTSSTTPTTSTTTTSSTSSSTATSTSTTSSASTTTSTAPGYFTVNRTLSAQAYRNTNITVRILIDVNESNKPDALGIVEYYPAGWILTQASDGATNFTSPERIEWLFWFGGYPVADTELNYTLLIPPNANGTHVFGGEADVGEIEPFAISGDGSCTVTGECRLYGNYPPCGEITLHEIVEAIFQWTTGQMGIGNVINLIDSWVDPAKYPPD